MEHELLLLWLAVGGYLVAGGIAASGVLLGVRPTWMVLGFLGSGLGLHAAAIALRWLRLGHGPFITMHEILSSNLWSLLFVFAVVYARFPSLRQLAAFVLPLLFLMMGWMLLTDFKDSVLPPTYDTVWLYIHVILGKIFLGAALVATGAGLAMLTRAASRGAIQLPLLPNDPSLDEFAYRCLAVGLLFDTLMLFSGAIWAQDAWGRYWDWDVLEVWSLINWLFLVMALHIRPAFRPPYWVNGLVATMVFVVGFLIFFGVPFLSKAPHKGIM